MESIEEKLNELTRVAFCIAYSNTRNGLYHDTRDIDLREHDHLVWSLVDGLQYKWLDDCMNGRCSLRATLDFDLAAEEKKIDAWLVDLHDLYSKLEPIYELSKAAV